MPDCTRCRDARHARFFEYIGQRYIEITDFENSLTLLGINSMRGGQTTAGLVTRQLTNHDSDPQEWTAAIWRVTP
jgi:hypothetical protein